MPGRSRVPILLLHAFPLDVRMWEAQGVVLEQAGYEVIAPNLPGREPDNELSWAERLLQLLPGNFVPMGCSMGAPEPCPLAAPRDVSIDDPVRARCAPASASFGRIERLRRRNVATPELDSRTREPAR